MTTTRIASIAAALLLAAGSAHAQALATYGSVEVGGFGEGSALIGSTLSTGRQGWGPIASLNAQTYRYRSGVSSHKQAFAVSPSVGMSYTTGVGSVSGSLGYTFVNEELGNLFTPGGEFGSRNSPFVTLQAGYWGNGEKSAQWIGNYGFESNYYWTRFRASRRLAPSENPIYVGGEFVLQGLATDTDVTINNVKFRQAQSTRFQIGPTIEYRVTSDFRVGASAGFRGGSNNTPGSGYARLEFLKLTRW